MTRKSNGKLRKMSDKDKQRRQERNERRGRDSKVAAWEKEHIVKPKQSALLTRAQAKKSKRKDAALAMAEALAEKVPAIDEAKAG
jgi:hypothetical protein